MTYDIAALVQEALDSGFTAACALDVRSLVFMPEVLDMCTANTCHQYNRNWMCPPGCGSVESMAARTDGYTGGVIVQTTAQLEDEFDFDTMGETYKSHERRYAELIAKLRARYPDVLPLGADSCKLCESCTYPDAPCRFPDIAISPMEAYGLLVSKVCALSGIPYYYGKLTLTYTGCYLLK